MLAALVYLVPPESGDGGDDRVSNPLSDATRRRRAPTRRRTAYPNKEISERVTVTP